ncbi:hypothetical protein ACLMJK_004283 [Lecanora helva]
MADPDYGGQEQARILQNTAAASSTTMHDLRRQDLMKCSLESFRLLAQIGIGNTAKLFLGKIPDTQNPYAIKVIKKKQLIDNCETSYARIERDILIKARKHAHPFIIELYSTFRTECSLCFVMEYAAGGDLSFHMQKKPLGVDGARFYAAEICLALKFLHENNILYRNLKGEHVLLCQDGHVKLIGFGISKELPGPNGKTASFCGTQEFMAPEILLDKSYGIAVDWWSFGVLLYQMLTNTSPFLGEDADEIYDAILANDLRCLTPIPEHAQTIVVALLERWPKERLGSREGFEEVKLHAFFQDIDWGALYEKRIEPPSVPTLQDATDLSNFDAELTNIVPNPETTTSGLSLEQQENFREFDYDSKWFRRRSSEASV